jgi:penicillin amidase
LNNLKIKRKVDGATNKASPQIPYIFLLFLLTIMLLTLVPKDIVSGSETIEILRDYWGIPHIFASSSEGVFYGLGYATAQDRMFQMEYSRRIVKGRISELVGEKGLQSDKLWRTIGWYRSAQETAKNLDSQTIQLLQAYSAGVNRYLQESGNLLYLFENYGITPEPWTVADSISCWYRLSYHFSGLDKGEVTNLYDFEELIEQVDLEEATNQLFTNPIVDETGAIVQEQDMNPDLIAEIKDYLTYYGYDSNYTWPTSKMEEQPKASHAWVIGGNRTTTGTAILHSDPQLLIYSPSIWYEFHICGGEFDARGIGVAGAPSMLIGWNQDITWGATAAKGDVVDLYRLEINPQNANEYLYDGVYRAMEFYNEEITLRNGTIIPIKYRNTVLGPVVTSLLSNSRRDEFTMQHAEVCNSSLCSLKSGIELMKANDYESFRSAIENYMSPSIHMIYGDKNGNIAYQLLSGIPLRSAEYPFFGRVAQPGNSSAYNWKEVIPKKYLPHSFNPTSGAISTANNMAAGSWYPLPISFGTGDTIRSWRLREKLSMQYEFSQEDVLSIHQDTVNPAVRELVRLARHIADNFNQTLSSQTLRTLDALQAWNGQYNTSQPVYPLISNCNLMFRSQVTPLALTYGGGEGGLCNFAKKINQDLNTNTDYVPTEDEKNYVDSLLGNAWTKTIVDFGSNQSEWLENYDKTVSVKYQNNLENLGSLNPNTDFTSPSLMCKHTATILSQHGNSYSQNVRFDNIDLSRSVLPPGISEDPNSPFFDNQIPVWVEGELHPAPLSREIIEGEATSTTSLPYPPASTATPTPTPTPSTSPSPQPTATPPITPTPTPHPTPSPFPSPKKTASNLPTETQIAIVIIIAITLGVATALYLKKTK